VETGVGGGVGAVWPKLFRAGPWITGGVVYLISALRNFASDRKHAHFPGPSAMAPHCLALVVYTGRKLAGLRVQECTALIIIDSVGIGFLVVSGPKARKAVGHETYSIAI